MMLKEHIDKPLCEMMAKKEGQGKTYKGVSADCRMSKFSESNMVKLLENVPITKKPVKKPKLNKFVNV